MTCKTSCCPSTAPTQEGFTEIAGQRMYAIPGYDRMPAFLMSVVSDSDVWAFVSSAGGLTAGRVEPAHALFPYEAEDKIHTCHPFTGPKTCLRITRPGEAERVWQPFVDEADGASRRCLYKNVLGTQLVFEETRDDLGMTFRYRWAPTDRFGLVRTAWLENRESEHGVQVHLIDGLLNLLPAGIPLAIMQGRSSLANAYTQAEVDESTGLAIYSLTSRISDNADPGESLTANVAWSQGLDGRAAALLPEAYESFVQGHGFRSDRLARNRRPCFLNHASFTLGPGEMRCWHTAADANRTQPQVVDLQRRLRDRTGLGDEIEQAIGDTTKRLMRYVAASDGVQLTGDAVASAHHAVNVMFNVMRGGAIADGYRIDLRDFLDFLRVRHRDLAPKAEQALPTPPPKTMNYYELRETMANSGVTDLVRLTLEYLPLTFGRRHGDPSRPWNMFAINVRQPDGSRVYDYQGNWRDIFQNWEAMARSFPGYLPGIIAKFVNATTRDGHNPYRISREGIDWEIPDPHDPWAHIGYWGDHQIIYLLKLMEQCYEHDPDELMRMLRQRIFSYADVPYAIKPYHEVLADPSDSIRFDWEAHRSTESRTEAMGTDGRLVPDSAGGVLHATLAEKLLVTSLAKLSGLVIGGGVWMNTQRPEWNDANNALAGWGCSVVTTCYLHRHLRFLRKLIGEAGEAPLKLNGHVKAWAEQVSGILARALGAADDDAARCATLDQLGQSFQAYREAIADDSAVGRVEMSPASYIQLLDTAIDACRETIVANRRDDGLYHAYNILSIDEANHDARVRRLDVMLEGQVAVLSSGVLAPDEAAKLIEDLFESHLYREDLGTFVLYPIRDMPRYLERNRVDGDAAGSIPLLTALLDAGDGAVISRDSDDAIRFNSRFANAKDLSAALDRIEQSDADLAPQVSQDRNDVLALFEATFDHQSFTGRSGTMYGYEGLGCVYWHMVAKLLLAAQEACIDALRSDARSLERCLAGYERVRNGLGFKMTATQFGAFPLDPYSHTPLDRGAQQPGMTGQVKEEVLTRLGELGVLIEAGSIRFEPGLIHQREFLAEPQTWSFTDGKGVARDLELAAGDAGLSLCQVPVVLRRVDAERGRITVAYANGKDEAVEGLSLPSKISRMLFARSQEIEQLTVDLPRSSLA